jgi:glutamine synthetase
VGQFAPSVPVWGYDHRQCIVRVLGEALDALDEDGVVRGALPAELYETFVAIKRDEWHRACGAVTEWDRETYLNYLP